MNDLNESNFQGFEKLLATWRGAHVCAVHSYVAIKSAAGPRLLFGRVLLAASWDGIDKAEFRFETEHILAGRLVDGCAPNDPVGVIARARTGAFQGLDGDIVVGTEPDRPFHTQFAPIYHPWVSEGARLPGLLIFGTTKSALLQTAGDTKHLDWELKAAVTPFESLDDLLGHCGLPMLAQFGDFTTLEIVARAPAVILDDSGIVGDEAVVKCAIAKALDVKKLRLGYRMLGKNVPGDRRSVTGESLQWQEEKDSRIGVYRIPTKGSPAVQAFLSYDGISLHQWFVLDRDKLPNLGYAIYKTFDEDSELLRRMLVKPEPDNASAFEWAVSTIFTLLGFSPLNYGRIPKLQRGADIIAVTYQGHIAVVECTLAISMQRTSWPSSSKERSWSGKNLLRPGMASCKYSQSS